MASLTDDEYKAIARRAYDEFRRIDPDNVFAVGVGGRIRAGVATDEIVLKVYVDRKLAPSALASGKKIPDEFEGVATDVLVATRPTTHQLQTVPGFRFSDTFPEDEDRYRPLRGGIQIQGSFREGAGTLGFLARVTGDTRIMAVTCHHVLFSPSGTPGPDVTVGNPTPDESCTQCCVHRFGSYVKGYYNASIDAVISRLDPGMQWLAEIEQLGIVRGHHLLTIPETMPARTYDIRKRGRTTRMTGGKVDAVGVTTSTTAPGLGTRTCTNAITVVPNARSDGAPVRFSAPGDSGSAYVNNNNEIVGVHFAGEPTQTATDAGWGWGTDIMAVLNHFQSNDAIALVPATATAQGAVQTVPAAGARALAAATGEAAELARRLETELSTTEAGRLITLLWMRHGTELNALVNRDRKVMVQWHRNSGPALFQHAIRAARLPEHAIPIELDGRAVEERVAAILEMFTQHGSEHLRADLAAHRTLLPPLAGRTYQDILQDLRER